MKDPTTTPPAMPKIPSLPEVSVNIICPNCRLASQVQGKGPVLDFHCGFCRVPVTARTFPCLSKGSAPVPRGIPAAEGDATCQFFPEVKAEVICDECGCFMSQKAAAEWGDKTLCLPCLHRLREEKSDTEFRADLKIWDNRALGLLALLPLTLFTAPAALFILVKFRKEPKSWIPRSSLRWWIALALTVTVLLGWTALVVIWIAMLTRELS